MSFTVSARRSLPLALATIIATFASSSWALEESVDVINATPADLAMVSVAADGDGVNIGQLESGIPKAQHSALPAGQMTAQPGGLTVSDHATKVAGVMLSQDGANTGVAPAANLFSASISAGNTGGRDGDVIKAGDWLDSRNVKVLNMSNGGSGSIDGTSRETLYADWLASTRDIIFVKSAGNNGDNGSSSITRPGDGYNVITVGAMGPNDVYNQVADFSSEGRTDDLRNKPDLVAPGVGISMPVGTGSAFTSGANSSDSNGTSFAAPHVTGTAALLVDAGRSGDHRAIKAVLLNSASKDGGEKPGEIAVTDKTGNAWQPGTPGTDALDNELGAGLLNATAAFRQFQPAEAAAGLTGLSEITVDPIAWDIEDLAGGDSVDYMINAPLARDSKITATLIWDRPITRDATGENTDPWTDTFSAGDLAALNMTLIDEDGEELSLTDSLGRASYSTSPVDSVEHFYFTIPSTDVYGVRVKHLLSSDQNSAEFAFAVWSTVIPEPMTLLAFAGLLISRRRPARP